MKKTAIRFLTPLLVVIIAASMAFSQGSTYLPNPGRYGFSDWAINNQRVASQYNYFIDSLTGSGLGAYTFPPQVIYQALPLGGGKYLNPFNTNAPVKVIDINSANTETVTFNSNTCTTGGGVSSVCTLSLGTSNAHTSYILRSGTCGLREALNDLGTNGGEVIVDQRFYDDGCTQATITGINALVATATSSGVGPLYANQYVHDISNGQDTWYRLAPNATTLISSAGAALTLTGSAGGSLTNSGTYYVNYEYVDPLGGQGLANTESSQITLSSQNTITTTAVAAATGAVGWIPMITASAGSSGTEIAVPVTAAVCTLSTLTPYPACAIGSAAVITANPSSTAKENVESFGHAAFGFLPIGGVPNFASAGSSASSTSGGIGAVQTSFAPFGTIATISAAASSDVAQFYLPAGAMNFLGRTIDICFKANYSITSTGVPTFKLNVANAYGQSPVTLATVVQITQAAAVSGTGCFNVTTASTGTSGTLWADGNITQTLNSSGAGTVAGDVTTAASSAINLTLPTYWSINVGATTASVTSFTMNALTVRQAPGN